MKGPRQVHEPLRVAFRGAALDGRQVRRIQGLVDRGRGRTRQALARELCRRFGWRRPNGSWAIRGARQLLIRLDKAGVIHLPAPRRAQGRPGRAGEPAALGNPAGVAGPAAPTGSRSAAATLVVRPIAAAELPYWRAQLERFPWGGVWVSLESGLTNVTLEDGQTPPDWTLALDSLVELGLKFARSRPARLEVVDETLGQRVAAALGDPELSSSVVGDLPVAKRMLRAMVEHGQDVPLPPDALWARGVTVERMRAFAEAARAFYQAAPWRHLSDADLVHVEEPAVAHGLRCATVLGAAGQTYGLAFFASAGDFEAFQAATDVEASLRTRGRWTVFFGPPWGMPPGDADLWEDHGLAVAGPSAYPLAVWFGADGELRRPEARQLADLEAVLLALAATAEEDIDRGRWSREVATFEGPRAVTLSIPELLVPLDAAPPGGPRPLGDRRAMERVLREVERFVADRQFADDAEASAAIQQRFRGHLDDVPSTAATPLDKAQDLVYRAFEARGRRRIQLARKALELSPDCADAYTVLAEQARDVERALDLYAAGVDAAERALGPAVFAEQAGHFWGLVQTRPYMRARFGLAQSLEALGRREEAMAHYRALLRLNPNDNQGVRYSLLALLLELDRDDEAGSLMAEFADEPTALWRYGRALWTFRREGDGPAARGRLDAALRSNRYAARYLTGDDEPGPRPASYALGSEEEAIVCETCLGDVWRATPGAADWLRRHARRAKGKRRRR